MISENFEAQNLTKESEESLNADLSVNFPDASFSDESLTGWDNAGKMTEGGECAAERFCKESLNPAGSAEETAAREVFSDSGIKEGNAARNEAAGEVFTGAGFKGDGLTNGSLSNEYSAGERFLSEEETERRNVLRHVESDMVMLGLQMHMNGFKYIRDAVDIVLRDSDYIRSMSKDVYPLIAMKNYVTPGSVEVSIRRAIRVAWDLPSGCMRKKIYRYSSGVLKTKPTNSQFVALLSWRAVNSGEDVLFIPPMENSRAIALPLFM